MADLITATKRLVGQTAAASPWTEQQIQDQLDQNRTHFDYVLLDRDSDYRHFWSRAWSGTPESLYRRPVSPQPISIPDFSLYTRCGFYETDYSLRSGRTEDDTSYTADDANLNDGTFIFSTAPAVELYFAGKGYNVYQAAADLMLETPDFGRLALQSESRGSLSQTYAWAQKAELYSQRGRKLNKRIPRLLRA
jgi:hypothetical protein